LPVTWPVAGLVDDYFVVGPRETSWRGGKVVKYHRTIETYVAVLQTAGFVVDRLREFDPQRSRFADDAEYARRTRIPLFLFFAAHRPAFGRRNSTPVDCAENRQATRFHR
jgi:hypothetical protein